MNGGFPGNKEYKAPAVKPQLLVCYLCGQQFGTSSLAIHVPQCYVKKSKQWDAGDPSTRGKKPRHPDTVDWQTNSSMTKEEYNDKQFKDFNENLEPCPNCGRKFAADRLVVHLRSCDPGRSGGGSKPVNGKAPPTVGGRPGASSGGGGGRPGTSGVKEKLTGPAAKPQLLVCYLCGQQFGTSSLAIHVPQCYDKKTRQWEAGDPETRGKKPRHPDTVDWQTNSSMTKEEYNDKQFKDFNENLEPCPNCGRKFAADRLVVHLRSCDPGRSGGGSKPVNGRPVTQGGGGAGGRVGEGGNGPSKAKGPAVKPQLLVCYLCGQQFGTSSLAIHVPQCYDKKTRQWEAGDPETRGKKPRHPDTVDWQTNSSMTKEEYNDKQFKDFNENLEPCPNCGRKFLADRLVVHLRSCDPGKSGGGSKPIGARPMSRQPTATEQEDQRASTSSPGRPIGGRLGGLGGASDQSAGHSTLPGTSTNPLRNRLPPTSPISNKGNFISSDDSNPNMNASDGTNGKNSTHNKFSGKSRVCIRCSCVEYDDKAKFCRDCGTSLDIEAMDKCESCGDPCPSDARFCPTCGNAINGAQAADRTLKMSPGKLAGLTSPNKGAPQQKKKTSNSCPNCDCEVAEDGNFCDNCGCRLGLSPQNEVPRPPSPPEIIQMKCLECNELYEDGARFCEECGGELIAQPVKPKTWADDRLDSTQLPETTTPGYAKTQKGANPHENDGDDEYAAKPPSQQNVNPSRKPNTTTQPTQVGGSGAPKAPYKAPPPPQQQKYQQQQADAEEDTQYENDQPERGQCSICNRYFALDVLARHEDFCQRQKAKARKVFDSRKSRMTGTESEGYIKIVSKNEKEEERKKALGMDGGSQSKWKQQSLAFRAAMRDARKVDAVLKAGGTAKDLPPPTYSDNSHLTPCPHCGRRFAAETAERHIPKCATTVNKPKPPPKLRR